MLNDAVMLDICEVKVDTDALTSPILLSRAETWELVRSMAEAIVWTSAYTIVTASRSILTTLLGSLLTM